MANVKIPTTQQGLIDLGKALLAKAPKAAKVTKVKFPREQGKQIRKDVRLAERYLKVIKKLTEALTTPTKRLNEALGRIDEASRDAAQILKRMLGNAYNLEEYGYDVGQTMRREKKAPQA